MQIDDQLRPKSDKHGSSVKLNRVRQGFALKTALVKRLVCPLKQGKKHSDVMC